jgi:ABC-type dipeptide/oligopeptide/nickel transport system permease component
MPETMNADYMRTAHAKGLAQAGMVHRHAFRNAPIPIATVFALDFGAHSMARSSRKPCSVGREWGAYQA